MHSIEVFVLGSISINVNIILFMSTLNVRAFVRKLHFLAYNHGRMRTITTCYKFMQYVLKYTFNLDYL